MKELSASGGSGKDRGKKKETQEGHSGASVSADPENESESRAGRAFEFRFGDSGIREDAVLAQPSRWEAVRRKNVTGLTSKRDEWSMNARTTIPRTKRCPSENDVHLPTKNSNPEGNGCERTSPRARRVANVYRRRFRLMEGRRSYAELSARTQARATFL